MTIKKSLFGLSAVLAVLVGLYPLVYLLIDRHFGLLASKSAELLSDPLWNVGFYLHIFSGGLALLIGWSQFVSRWRLAYPATHRALGKVYIITSLITGVSGLGIALAATGGPICQVAFFASALLFLASTLMAYKAIRKGQVAAHRQWMILSYALCFSAVTLRLWLPLFAFSFGEFIPAYRLAAWVSWVPNVVVAYWLARPKSVA